MKRIIEIEDTLDERVQDASDETKELLLDYLKENPDVEDTPELYGDLDYSGGFHEIIDSAVPIYTAEIEGLWYLYSDKFEQAYEDAGFGDNSRDNNGMVAIFCYIEQQVAEWYESNACAIFEEWQDQQKIEETDQAIDDATNEDGL